MVKPYNTIKNRLNQIFIIFYLYESKKKAKVPFFMHFLSNYDSQSRFETKN